MSATSKLIGFREPVEGDDSPSAALAQDDADRRRYLMRYVVGAVGLAGIICIAAGIRVAAMRANGDDAAPPTRAPNVVSPIAAPPQPPEVTHHPETAQLAATAVAAEARPVVAAPVPEAPKQAAARVEEPSSPPPPVAATPKKVAAPPPAAPARAPAPAAAHPQARKTAIVHDAPF